MEKHTIQDVGLDVHKDTIAMATADEKRSGKNKEFMKTKPDIASDN